MPALQLTLEISNGVSVPQFCPCPKSPAGLVSQQGPFAKPLEKQVQRQGQPLGMAHRRTTQVKNLGIVWCVAAACAAGFQDLAIQPPLA